MTERRRFSGRERIALYLAADGHCTECGAELDSGWHGDHVTPHSRGGKTDVINGQALCAACNLRKGGKMTGLRIWQEEALAAFLRTDNDFLLVACPGAGKTTFAVVAAQRLIERGVIDRVLVVVPTAHLRIQWAKAAAAHGLQLDSRFVNGAAVVASDFDGAVVTYAAVASARLLYRHLAAHHRTLVILDEIHHGGDELAWGAAITEAFQTSVRRLLLSGTPTRSDRRPVPFVRYGGDGKFICDFHYDYGAALGDRTVVRPVEFLALDGSVRWREAGAIVTADLKDANEEALANALSAALNPDADWIRSVLARADTELSRHRTTVPDAGGLVVAFGQSAARRYAAILGMICGEQPVLAMTDEPDSSGNISEFARGTSRWLVAVQMVSEGVDIPRVSVGVYASKIRTDLFFSQVTGRFVRTRSPEDDTTATLLIPSIEPLLSYARAIERTTNEALRQQEEEVRREAKEHDGQIQLDLVEPIDSSEAVHHSTILSGDSFTDEELRRGTEMAQICGLPASVTAAHMARVLRILGAGRVVGTAVLTPSPSAPPLVDQKASMRRLVQRKVGQLSRIDDEPHAHIHHRLNQICGDTTPIATAATISQRLDLLDKWIGES